MYRKIIPVSVIEKTFFKKLSPTVLFLLIFGIITGCIKSGGDTVYVEAPKDAQLPGIAISEMMGLNSLLYLGTSQTARAKRAVQFEMNQYARIKYLRQVFHWNTIEPSQGTFDFRAYDQILDEAEQYGQEFLGMFLYCALWNCPDGTCYPPSPTDYAKFVRQVVARYKDRIHMWEIWNEENFSRFWLPTPDAYRYGILLKETAKAIREVDPSAIIVLGGLCPLYDQSFESMWGYLIELYALHPDIGEYYDVLAIHPYTYLQFAPPESDNPANPLDQSVPHMIKEGKRILAMFGEQKPIWITEIGWHTSPLWPLGSATREQQADYLIRSLVLSASEGVEKYFWYCFEDRDEWMTNTEDSFGLVEYDPDPLDANPPAPKPSYTAYATIGAVLGDTGYVTALSTTPQGTARAHLFAKLDFSKQVIVVWNETEEVTVKVPSLAGMTKFKIVDRSGNETIVAPQDGFIEVTAGESPLFVVQER